MTDEASPQSEEHRIAADIVARIAGGDARAEEEFVARYRPRLVFLLRRNTGNAHDAEDLAHKTLLAVLPKLREGRLDSPQLLGAYLRGTAMNQAGARWRKDARRRTSPDSEAVEAAADDRDSATDVIEREQRAAALRAAIDSLQVQRDQQILRRYYFDDADTKRICRELDVKPEHFPRVLYRARQRLRQVLENEGGGSLLEVVR